MITTELGKADETHAFCETYHAPPLAPWHIRRLTEAGRRTGGGADSASLCGRVEHLPAPTTCADCSAPAVGLRPNLDREPSCPACEADRLAMIAMLLDAAAPERATQRDLFEVEG